jgi:hypothetical protein
MLLVLIHVDNFAFFGLVRLNRFNQSNLIFVFKFPASRRSLMIILISSFNLKFQIQGFAAAYLRFFLPYWTSNQIKYYRQPTFRRFHFVVIVIVIQVSTTVIIIINIISSIIFPHHPALSQVAKKASPSDQIKQSNRVKKTIASLALSLSVTV